MSVHTMSNRAPLISAGLFLAAAFLCWLLLSSHLPTLLLQPDGYDVERMITLYSTLPRMATALLCGAALSLSGVLLQIVLRNPLASPTTLGVSAGAHLALVLATLFAPALISFSRDLVAAAGSAVAAGLVFALVARRNFSPVTLILGGLVVSLYCGAAATLLVLLNDRFLASLFIWGAGSLSQQDWSIPVGLAPKFAVLALATLFLLRPLAVLNVGDEAARALGGRPELLRALTVAIAIGLAALVTSAVGVIGFIGLAAPALARISGARTIGSQVLWSTLIGSSLLFLTDNALQVLAGSLSNFVPTGAVTALFGSPLLLLLLGRIKTAAVPESPPEVAKRWSISLRPTLFLVALVPASMLALAILVGRDADGSWGLLTSNPAYDMLLDLRVPRSLNAAAAGAMLAVAGVILQRLSGNDMASPEVLGVSSGAMLGLAFGVFFIAPGQTVSLVVAGSIGALLIMSLVLLINRRTGFQAEGMVLAGIAFTALLDAFIGALAATGDLRSLLLLRWMSGSTYGADWQVAVLLMCFAVVLILAALALFRWIDLLELGAGAANALGVPVKPARGLLFCLAGLLTAAATLSVGPLSFIGLMSPHIARQLGFTRALGQLLVSISAGASLMLLADWIGRYGYFPFEMPSGLISALVGTPFLMILLSRRQA
ncbi:Fe(3+)-hydroxamate ABC transporter permease FhuB [Labrenzia sp. CE80]|uniref:Fe(3+)-hydroxamate ABC transporter permease FhuB n=1 Tax=Labrenzia sp. CE80 TaxID=1788986 RepID=UPI00129B8047|nr:Fe(3+)-hydroxamate ABC transporter permease FhuB [Labrenzia sp. CE80]